MEHLYYFAYGSNLHPLRLQRRVPSATLVGSVKLPGWQLHFHKRGQDGSGKCNILPTQDDAQHIYGAVYRLQAKEKPALDDVEGEGYSVKPISVAIDAVNYDCFVYLADQSHIDYNLRPFDWYQQLVTLGAAYHAVPETYLQQLQAMEPHVDLDVTRNALNQQLVQQILTGGK